MGISKPIVCEIARDTLAINEFGMAACFLLWGSERGLLIDTGCGMYNIKEIADELSPVPYDVMITHAHGDHMGGIDYFEEVYMHPDDFRYMTPEGMESRRERYSAGGGYAQMMTGFGSFDAYDITYEQQHYPERIPKLLPMPEGHVFHLGGRDIEVIHTPGHTEGEVCLIDTRERILFSGDACNPNLGISATSINTAYKGLLKVKARQADFDRNFNNHIGYGGSNVIRSIPAETLDDALWIMENLIRGTVQFEYRVSPMRPNSPPTWFITHGTCLINSRTEPRILDEGEEPAV